MAHDEPRAGVRQDKAAQHLDEGGFTGAVRPEQAEELAFVYFQVDALDGGDPLLLAQAEKVPVAGWSGGTSWSGRWW